MPTTSSGDVSGRTRMTSSPDAAASMAASALKTIRPLAAPGDDDLLASLDALEELREVSLGLEGAYGCHGTRSRQLTSLDIGRPNVEHCRSLRLAGCR